MIPLRTFGSLTSKVNHSGIDHYSQGRAQWRKKKTGRLLDSPKISLPRLEN